MDAPGYYWTWVEPLQQWVLRWEAVPGVYSPPIHDSSVSWIHIHSPNHIKSPGAISAKAHDAVYIYHRRDLGEGVLEIWSRDLPQSVISINSWFNSIKPATRSLKSIK